jgi:flagellar biosynthesis component FlhA
LLVCAIAAPMTLVSADAQAQSSQYARRQKTKNEWRNIAIASGALAVLGLIKDDPTLTFAGGAGALYSAWRYEEDRKSQNKLNRFRASVFSRPVFYRDGYKYTRKTKWKNGKKYYYFVKTKVR